MTHSDRQDEQHQCEGGCSWHGWRQSLKNVLNLNSKRHQPGPAAKRPSGRHGNTDNAWSQLGVAQRPAQSAPCLHLIHTTKRRQLMHQTQSKSARSAYDAQNRSS